MRKSSLVFDPFVGTGSILVAAAERGALTLGADIDMRILKLGESDHHSAWHGQAGTACYEVARV